MKEKNYDINKDDRISLDQKNNFKKYLKYSNLPLISK